MDIRQSPYFDQAKLLVNVIPHVFKEECFALKGGTAINLFLRDMPRLSVDIDLTYLPIEDRASSLKNIELALKRIGQSIKDNLPGIQIYEAQQDNPKMVNKLFIRRPGAQVKIEPNLVTRGTVFPNENRVLSPKAQEIFESFVQVKTVSLGDLFGGKICAALDRQHPRDLYDVKFLLEKEGITEQIRQGFIIYWLSHDRPIHELINPVFRDSKELFNNEFQGMAFEPVTYEDLAAVHANLVAILKKELTTKEKEFLLSFKKGNPNWSLLDIKGVENLPAVKWKQKNIEQMDKDKRELYLEKLRIVLG